VNRQKRKASMQSINAGRRGNLPDGTSVRLITNRYSGILVEVIQDSPGYRKGQLLQVGPNDFLTGQQGKAEYFRAKAKSL
jgi:hypothetical protein